MALKTTTIEPKAKGQKPIKFKEGGLHETLGIPQGQKIPATMIANALAGHYGPKARAEAQFMHNVLTGRH